MSTGSDRLNYGGEERALLSTPLEPYLRGLPARPEFWLPGHVSRNGYLAHWEVRADDTLWLNRLQTRARGEGRDPGLGLVFPGADGPIPATWVSQRLRSPASQLRYSPFGVSTVSELHLWVTGGRVVLVEERRDPDGPPARGRFTRHLEAAYGPEESAFLRAVHAAPGDSAPRLVYADWLDERGDPRGPVIRLDERLKGMDPDAQRAEVRAHMDVLRRGLTQGMWSWVMGYDALAALAQPIVTSTYL
jgi:uncharacterized protein (TIGR02996 family)